MRPNILKQISYNPRLIKFKSGSVLHILIEHSLMTSKNLNLQTTSCEPSNPHKCIHNSIVHDEAFTMCQECVYDFNII